MNVAEFVNEVEEIIEVDAGTLSLEDSLLSFEQWDSLAYLSVIAMIDEKYGLTLEGEALEKVDKVSDLIGLVGDKISCDA